MFFLAADFLVLRNRSGKSFLLVAARRLTRVPCLRGDFGPGEVALYKPEIIDTC